MVESWPLQNRRVLTKRGLFGFVSCGCGDRSDRASLPPASSGRIHPPGGPSLISRGRHGGARRPGATQTVSPLRRAPLQGHGTVTAYSPFTSSAAAAIIVFHPFVDFGSVESSCRFAPLCRFCLNYSMTIACMLVRVHLCLCFLIKRPLL